MDNQYLIQMEMKSIIHRYIFILLGIFILCYIVSIRLLINKLPKELPIITTYLEKLIYTFIPLSFLLISIITFLSWYKSVTRDSWIFSKIIEPVSSIYWKSLKALDAVIKDNISPKILGSNLLRFCKIYAQYYKLSDKRIYKITYILFNFVPKFLFLVIFSFDVLYKNKFLYTYYSAWLLLIPLAFNYFIFTLREFTEYNFDHYINNILDIVDEDNNYVKSHMIVISCKFRSYALFIENKAIAFDVLFSRIKTSYLSDNNISDSSTIAKVENERQNEFILFRLVRGHIAMLDVVKEMYGNILNAIYFFCLALLWFYVLGNGLL